MAQTQTTTQTTNKENGFTDFLHLLGGGHLTLGYSGALKVAHMAIVYALTNKDARIVVRFGKSAKTGSIFVESVSWGDIVFETQGMEEGACRNYWVVVDPHESENRRVCISAPVTSESFIHGSKDKYYPIGGGMKVLYELLQRVDKFEMHNWDYANFAK